MYDFAHGQSDYFEGVTHSICTLEFVVHRPLYDYFVDERGEVVGGIVFTVAPVETEPMDVVADGVDVFHVLFHWICVVETQVASAYLATHLPPP